MKCAAMQIYVTILIKEPTEIGTDIRNTVQLVIKNVSQYM